MECILFKALGISVQEFYPWLPIFHSSYGRTRMVAVARAFTTHQHDPSLIPGVRFMHRLSLLLVLVLASGGFPLGTPAFPSSQRPTLTNYNLIQESRAIAFPVFTLLGFALIKQTGCYTECSIPFPDSPENKQNKLEKRLGSLKTRESPVFPVGSSPAGSLGPVLLSLFFSFVRMFSLLLA